jgi:hypothetical protein
MVDDFQRIVKIVYGFSLSEMLQNTCLLSKAKVFVVDEL